MTMRTDRESQMGVQISKYLDNELSAVERDMLERHLPKCSSCRELLQVLRRNDELLKHSLGVEVYGNDIVDKVSKRLRREEKGEPAAAKIWKFARRPAFGVAAAALVVFGLLAVIVMQNVTIRSMIDRMNAQSEAISEQQESIVRLKGRFTEEQAKEDRRAALRRWETLKEDWVYAEPGNGGVVLTFKSPEGDEVIRWMIVRRMSGGDPVEKSTKDSKFTDPNLPAGETVLYSVKPITKSGRDYREQLVKVELPERTPTLFRHESRRGVARVKAIAYDARSGAATLEVSVLDGRKERAHAFQVKQGARVGGAELLHLSNPEAFRTGWVLVDVEREDQVIGSSANAVYTRPNWRLVLRTADGRKEKRVWIGETTDLPIRQP